MSIAVVRPSVLDRVRRDLCCGEWHTALSRLVAVGDSARAADLLADHGITMILSGACDAIGAFVAEHPESVLAQPQCWFPVAVERWRAGDTAAAGRWMQMILAPDSPARPGRAEMIVLRLMGSRTGSGSARRAVDRAQGIVTDLAASDSPSARDSSILPLLLIELGTTQNWLGDARAAETNLTSAAGICRSSQWPEFVLEAESHLAFSEYLMGRFATCRRLAEGVLQRQRPAIDTSLGFSGACTVHRAALARLLCDFVEVDPPGSLRAFQPMVSVVHAADVGTRFWLRIAQARLKMSDRRFSEARQLLDLPIELPIVGSLPRYLHRVLVLDQAFCDVLMGDALAVKAGEARCRELGLEGEALLLARLRADLVGGHRSASALSYRAAEQLLGIELRSSPQLRPQLSARQQQVLWELARGCTYADIAANLYVSQNTVKTHIAGLYAKLGVANRSQALAAARAVQLI